MISVHEISRLISYRLRVTRSVRWPMSAKDFLLANVIVVYDIASTCSLSPVDSIRLCIRLTYWSLIAFVVVRFIREEFDSYLICSILQSADQRRR